MPEVTVVLNKRVSEYHLYFTAEAVLSGTLLASIPWHLNHLYLSFHAPSVLPRIISRPARSSLVSASLVTRQKNGKHFLQALPVSSHSHPGFL